MQQPSVAPPNTTRFVSCSSDEQVSITRCASLSPSQFCNDVPGCHLCLQPDPFVPERNEVTCMWRPESGRSCKSQGSVYRPAMCPFYTGEVSDCVNDDTLPFVPACPIELVHGCTSLNYTACSQQANCTWCFEYDKVRHPEGVREASGNVGLPGVLTSSAALFACALSLSRTLRRAPTLPPPT